MVYLNTSQAVSSQLSAVSKRPSSVRPPLADGRPLSRPPLDTSGRSSYNAGMKTIVSEKGQITIPKPLRVRLGIRTGQVLEVREEHGRLVMAKQKATRDAIDELYGILKLDRSTDEIIDEMRGSERPK